jgi:hypothetical protein
MDAWESAGEHVIHWDGKGSGNVGLASGIYLVRLETSSEVAVRKVVIMD